MKYMIVSAEPLFRLLSALVDRSGIQIRELQATRGLTDNPIDVLINEYDIAAKENNKLFHDGQPTMDDKIQEFLKAYQPSGTVVFDKEEEQQESSKVLQFKKVSGLKVDKS